VGDGASAVAAIERHRPDVAFLDVRMPGDGGMTAAERVQGLVQIVFVTAYDQHAVAAFERGAVDYLLKPVRPERLAETVRRLKERLGTSDPGADAPPLRWIQASVGNVLRFVPVEEVRYFQSEDKYTKLVTETETALIRRALKDLLPALDPDTFWRINRSAIVNLRHVEGVVRAEGEVTVRIRGNPRPLRVSKAYQQRFRGM
jgi:DNA-binding LytR/AlgR family response regulator